MKPKKCKNCGKEFTPFRPLDFLCSYKCANGYKKPTKRRFISPVSKSKAKKDKIYQVKRQMFLEGKFCPITGKAATEVHHTYSGADRSKYYLDESTWVAVSREGHNYIHNNPIWAKENGYLK